MSADAGLARLAHDLANALAAAIARLSVLEHQGLPRAAAAEVRGVLGDLAGARERVREILERAHGESRAAFSLLEAWRHAAAPLEEAGTPTPIDAATPAVEAFADRTQIEELLASIVGTERATGAAAPVEAQIASEGDRMVLVVRSHAPRFAEADLEKLLDPFFLKKPDGFGTGVGFALCQRIAAKNGGSFALRSSGDGREYRLELPATPKPVASPASPLPRPAPAGRCLVVDDDGRVRESCGLMLRHLGMEFELAASGREALERLGSGSFDAVILDLHLGKPVDGEDVLEELRRTRPEVLARTILATGDPTCGIVSRLSRELGVVVLAKPFGVDELLQGISRLRR